MLRLSKQRSASIVISGLLLACGSPRVAGTDGGVTADAGRGADAGAFDAGVRPTDGGTVDGGAASALDGGIADGGANDAGVTPADAGSSEVADCPVPSLVDLYPGAFPTNPYASGPAPPSCVLGLHDAIMVLGCPSQSDGQAADCQIRRADIALALSQRGLGDRFIVSGAAVQNTHVEADALRALLLARGVSADRIFREPLATHTDENLYYSTRIMEAQGWRTALVVSEDPGHLIMTAVCDCNCCVQLGRMTVFDIDVTLPGGSTPAPKKVGHYVRVPPATLASAAECEHIKQPLKFMCSNLSSRRACAGNLQLP